MDFEKYISFFFLQILPWVKKTECFDMFKRQIIVMLLRPEEKCRQTVFSQWRVYSLRKITFYSLHLMDYRL